MNLPDKQLLRRGEVAAYLGASESMMTKLIEANVLTPIYLLGNKGRAFFRRTEVLAIALAQGTKGTETKGTIKQGGTK